MSKIFKKSEASAMLIVVFILAGLFLIAFGAGYRVFFSVKTGDTQSQSLRADAAATAGLERARYEIKTGDYFGCTATSTNIFGTTTIADQTSYTVDCIPTSTSALLRVYGNYKNIQRINDVYFPSCADLTQCGSPCFYENVIYNTVEINGQCWFADNLNTGALRLGGDGDQQDYSLVL